MKSGLNPKCCLDHDTWAKPCGDPAGAAAEPLGPGKWGNPWGNPLEIQGKYTLW